MTEEQLNTLAADIERYKDWLRARGMASLSLEATTLILRLVNDDITALTTRGEVSSR